MATPITIPRLGWNMEEGTFLGWLKAPGEPIRAGEALFTLESEKATEDVECLEEGVLHIPADGPKKGDVLPVGAVIGFVLQVGEQAGPQLRATAAPALAPAAPAEVSRSSAVGAVPHVGRVRPASSPRARRAAARLGVDWNDATGTGRTGRIRERDVLALAAQPPGRSTRRLIAERMLTSHRSTAPVTLTTTVDATPLVKVRERWKASGAIAPTYTDLFVRLAAVALGKHPALNARWENERVVPCDGIHIGVAVDTDAGLLVPVVRDVPRLTLEELAVCTRDLVDRARQGKLAAGEMQGGTFTVTSLGAFGIDAFTPLINYPECAILGIGRIRRVPAVVDDRVVIRDEVTLSLTFDHRVTDGAPAARFLQMLGALVFELELGAT